MGCFDSFVLDDFLECPLCGAKEEGEINEFQTKEFGEFLHVFKVGDEVVFNGILQLKNGKYAVYTACEKCNAWITANIIIESGRFIGITEIKAIPQEEKWKEIRGE